MHITTTMLRKLGACRGQREKFRAIFPNGVTVTRELCLRHAHEFDFGWAVYHLLSKAAQEAYEDAREAAREAYETARAGVREAYEAAARAGAGEAYEAALAAVWEAYKAALALAFYDATVVHDASLDN